MTEDCEERDVRGNSIRLAIDLVSEIVPVQDDDFYTLVSLGEVSSPTLVRTSSRCFPFYQNHPFHE